MPQAFTRLEKRLDEARSKHFVGRSAELALFHDALTLDPPSFAVLWMVGPGGVGKSTLLGRFAMLVRQAGAQPIVVDARALVGTQSSFLDVLAREVGGAAAEVAQALGGAGRSVLSLGGDPWTPVSAGVGGGCSPTRSLCPALGPSLSPGRRFGTALTVRRGCAG